MDLGVVKIAGKQHLVSPGKVIEVEGSLGKVGDEVAFSEVLLAVTGEKVRVGTPLVERTKVTAKIKAVGKGDKIRVTKFKAKSRYRRVMGFRPLVTQLEILSVGE